MGHRYSHTPTPASAYKSAYAGPSTWSPGMLSYAAETLRNERSSEPDATHSFAETLYKGKMVANPSPYPVGFIFTAHDMATLGLYDPVNRTLPSEKIIRTVARHVCTIMGWDLVANGDLQTYIGDLIKEAVSDGS